MTNGSPLQIGLHHSSNVIHKSVNHPLLNIEDKKISASFSCKNTSKFWGGFAALALGIALGALLVAAVVVTGGLAGVAVMAAVAASTSTLAITTAAVAVGAAAAFSVTGIYKTSHACDLTLSSDWVAGTFHKSVRINQKNAILNVSVISCKNGGMVSIVLDKGIATDAAKKISENNNEELNEHYESEFLIGMVNGAAFTAFPSVIGVVIGGSIASYDYWHTQSSRDEDERKHVEKTKLEDVEGVALDNAKYLPTASTGDVANDYKDVRGERIEKANNLGEEATTNAGEAGKMQNQADDFAEAATQRELQGASENSVNSAKLAQDISQRSSDEFSEKAAELTAKSEEEMASAKNVGSVLKGVNWKHIGRGFGIGVAAAVVSYFIDDHFYEQEKDKQKETEEAFVDARKEDNKELGENHLSGSILAITH